MRKLILALALLLGVLFVIARFTELQNLLNVLRRGSIIYLGLALLAQIAWMVNLGAFYQSVYRALGMKEKLAHFVRLVTAAYFITVVAPSAGLSAIAVFVSDSKRKGRSIPRTTVASILYVWFEYIGNLAVLAIGFTELARRDRLHWSEITAASILLAGALGISLVLYLGLHSTAQLGKLLAWMARVVNAIFHPLIRRKYIAEERAHSFSIEIADGIAILRGNPRWVFRPLLLALLNKAILLLVLCFSFFAFDVPVNIGILIAGLSIAQLFLIVSPTPAGIGIVEGVLAVALRSLGLDLENATVVTLAYRGFSFWLPLLVGMVTIRLISHEKPVLEIIQKEPVPLSLEEKLK